MCRGGLGTLRTCYTCSCVELSKRYHAAVRPGTHMRVGHLADRNECYCIYVLYRICIGIVAGVQGTGAMHRIAYHTSSSAFDSPRFPSTSANMICFRIGSMMYRALAWMPFVQGERMWHTHLPVEVSADECRGSCMPQDPSHSRILHMQQGLHAVLGLLDRHLTL